jgi:hypothetical protein
MVADLVERAFGRLFDGRAVCAGQAPSSDCPPAAPSFDQIQDLIDRARKDGSDELDQRPRMGSPCTSSGKAVLIALGARLALGDAPAMRLRGAALTRWAVGATGP